tara:strand:+ start:7126 stop:7425 length:300 start_codon:yes stop_codon:yes gene_type:complete
MELQEIERSDKKKDDEVFLVKDESVMKAAIDVLTLISSTKKIILKADGELIPNGVAIANILTENILKGNSKIHDIILDSNISDEDGTMTSKIEITIVKN